MDNHYRCMIEKFLAHDHIDHFHLNSPAGLAGLAGIERGGVSERKEGEREEDDCWIFYKE